MLALRKRSSTANAIQLQMGGLATRGGSLQLMASGLTTMMVVLSYDGEIVLRGINVPALTPHGQNGAWHTGRSQPAEWRSVFAVVAVTAE